MSQAVILAGQFSLFTFMASRKASRKFSQVENQKNYGFGRLSVTEGIV